MNEARIKTCTRDPRLRLLFVGIALVLRNVWVWLHFKLAKGKWNAVGDLIEAVLGGHGPYLDRFEKHVVAGVAAHKWLQIS